MRYTEIRQHVLDHFRGMLGQFKDRVGDSGPIGPVRYAALETTQWLADGDLDTWAGLIHPEGKDGLVQAFCAVRGIPAADLTEQKRAWLLDVLRKGHGAFAQAARGHVDALERFDLDMSPGRVAGVGTADNAAASGQTQLSYQEVVDQYFAEVARSGGVAAKTNADKRAALNLLAEITGDKPVAAITKADAQRTKQVLMQYPANRQKNRITRGKQLSEVLDLPGVPKIAAKTMNSYLSNMETFIGWAAKMSYPPKFGQ